MKGWGLRYIIFVSFFMLGLPEQGQAAYEIDSNSSHILGKLHQSFHFPVPARKKQLDLSCFVSASNAYSKLKLGWTMVDVRAQSAFDKFRVSNSVNIPAHTVSSRAFLKNKKILLMDGGFNIDHVTSLCGNLKREGFSSVVSVFGGIVQWHQSGFALEGRVPHYSQLVSMPPDRFFQMKDTGFCYVINVSLKDDAVAQELFPEAVSAAGWKNVGEELDRIAAKHKGKQKLTAMILIDRDGKSYGKNIGAIQGKDYPIFFLAGGIDAYRDYLGKQQMIRGRLLHPPERRNFCGY